MTDQQLIDYSGEHLMHELSMFWELAHILPGRKASTETSAFVESIGIHLRNLIDFFYEEGRGDDVTARDFLDAATTWTPNKPERLEKARIRVNKELSHLTQSRKSGSPPEKEWDTVGLLKDIDAAAKSFAARASAKKLHDKVREFLHVPPQAKLLWIGDNVRHSNVATSLATSTTIVNASTAASTATQIITKATQLVTKPPLK
jgi:hypothetical protein